MQVLCKIFNFHHFYLVKFQKKNHISWLMYQFHYTDGIGCKVSLVRIPWYHAYSGIGTLIKKYDFFNLRKHRNKKFWKKYKKQAILKLLALCTAFYVAMRSDPMSNRSAASFFFSRLNVRTLFFLSIDNQRDPRHTQSMLGVGISTHIGISKMKTLK